MVSVICVGIALLDQIFKTPVIPTSGGKHFATDYMEAGGGPAATGAVAAARLGADTRLWARVGSDGVGTSVIGELAGYGVMTDEMRRVPDARSSLATVIVDDTGERMILSFPSPDLDWHADWLPLDAVKDADAVLADVRWQPGAAAALRAARDAGKPALLDADQSDDDISPLVEIATHAAFSEVGLKKYTQTSDRMDALRVATDKAPGWVCVTAGSDGCYWLEDGNLRHQPGFKIDVIDTTGAGDVFHGALAVALGEGLDVAHAVRFASAAAALKCTRLGGRAGIPARAELDGFLSENP